MQKRYVERIERCPRIPAGFSKSAPASVQRLMRKYANALSRRIVIPTRPLSWSCRKFRSETAGVRARSAGLSRPVVPSQSSSGYRIPMQPLYEFWHLLTSAMHMAWMRAVDGTV